MKEKAAKPKTAQPVDASAPSAGAGARDEGRSRLNATRHGILSRARVMPWEDAAEYDRLLDILHEEYQPVGFTEEKLVEDLADIYWRKQRLRVAEGAELQTRMASVVAGVDSDISRTRKPSSFSADALMLVSEHTDFSSEEAREVFRLSHDDIESEVARLTELISSAGNIVTLLEAHKIDCEEALRRMELVTGKSMDRYKEDPNQDSSEPEASASDKDLAALNLRWAKFIGSKFMRPWGRRKSLFESHELLRQQAYGCAVHPKHVEAFDRYEGSLWNGIERTLSMLTKLQQIRKDRTNS